MKKTLNIEICCGENTCASEPGNFCLYFSANLFGQLGKCNLFNRILEPKDGWMMRCEQCLACEKKEKK